MEEQEKSTESDCQIKQTTLEKQIEELVLEYRSRLGHPQDTSWIRRKSKLDLERMWVQI
jgi:hypothetical protein